MAKAKGSFAAKAASISKKQNIPPAAAKAILAAGARNASPAAKKKNPNLAKVKGQPRKARVIKAAKKGS